MSINWNYRQNLIKNADNLIRLKQSIECVEQPTFATSTKVSDKPYLYKSPQDMTLSNGSTMNKTKADFLQKNDIKSRKLAPEIKLKNK